MATPISATVKSELAPTGKLRVGLNHGNFLLVTPGSSASDPRGVAPDLARELGRRLGVPVEFIKFDTAGGLADAAKTNGWDVAFLGAEPQRANEIAFTAAYLEIPATYLVPAGSSIRSIADVDRALACRHGPGPGPRARAPCGPPRYASAAQGRRARAEARARALRQVSFHASACHPLTPVGPGMPCTADVAPRVVLLGAHILAVLSIAAPKVIRSAS